MKLKSEHLVIFLFLIILGMGVWIRSEIVGRKAAENISDKVVKDKLKEWAEDKKQANNRIEMYSSEVVKLNKEKSEAENKRISNAKYFKNELDKLKKINTYNSRVSYLDSIEVANGLRPSMR